MSSLLTAVPIEYAKRKRLWVNSSVWLGTNERSYVSLSIQGLGYAERMLLDMESRLAAMVAASAPRKDRDWLLMECSLIQPYGSWVSMKRSGL